MAIGSDGCFDDFEFEAFTRAIDKHLDSCRAQRGRLRRERVVSRAAAEPPPPVPARVQLRRFFEKHSRYAAGSVSRILGHYYKREAELHKVLEESWGESPAEHAAAADDVGGGGEEDEGGEDEDEKREEEASSPPHDACGFYCTDGTGGVDLEVARGHAAGWLRSSGADAAVRGRVREVGEAVVAGLVEKNASTKSIAKDMLRTFPTNHFFNAEESKHFFDLHRVLTGACRQMPDGYCQSMNFIAAVLIAVTGSEVASYHLLLEVSLSTRYNAGYYDKELSNCIVDQVILSKVLSAYPPTARAAARLQVVGCNLEDFTIRWFMCLFIDVVPFVTLLRIWDEYFKGGVVFLFRFSVACVGAMTGLLEDAEDSTVALPAINAFMLGLTDVEPVIAAAAAVPLTAAELARRREGERQAQAEARGGGGQGGMDSGDDSPALLSPGSSPKKKASFKVKKLFSRTKRNGASS